MDLLNALPSPDPWVLLALFCFAMLAGWVDAIGGGGGLIAIPALFWAGYSPVEVLATSKLQSSFGSLTATLNYQRQGLINWQQQRFAVLMTFIGSLLGAVAVMQLNPALLSKLIPLFLIALAIYLLLSPSLSDMDGQQRISNVAFALAAGGGIGFYDGFFGPGTGTFFVIAFVTLLGYGLPRATANTKLLNFASNFAALLMFLAFGHVVWLTGLIMAAGQTLGSWLGSQMAIKHGSRLIRPLLVTVSLLVSLRLLLDP